jgi:hypothetical protein
MGEKIIHLRKWGISTNREIIEYKYSSPHQKSAATKRKEKREFLYPFLQN